MRRPVHGRPTARSRDLGRKLQNLRDAIEVVDANRRARTEARQARQVAQESGDVEALLAADEAVAATADPIGRALKYFAHPAVGEPRSRRTLETQVAEAKRQGIRPAAQGDEPGPA
jgi:hypothetical protein